MEYLLHSWRGSARVRQRSAAFTHAWKPRRASSSSSRPRTSCAATDGALSGVRSPMGVIKVSPFFDILGSNESLKPCGGYPTRFAPFEPPSHCFEPGSKLLFEGSPTRNVHFQPHSLVSNRVRAAVRIIFVRKSHAVCRFRTAIALFRTGFETVF